MPKFLHAHSGVSNRQRTTACFALPEWEEVKLDPDPSTRPDRVGSLLDLSMFEEASFDAVFSARTLEHFYYHEVEKILINILRVLKPEGYVVLIGTDIEQACTKVQQGGLLEKLYDSPAGPVAPLDILYGFRPALAAGKYTASFRCGFTSQSMAATLVHNGYASVWTAKNLDTCTFFAIAEKSSSAGEGLKRLANEHFGRP